MTFSLVTLIALKSSTRTWSERIRRFTDEPFEICGSVDGGCGFTNCGRHLFQVSRLRLHVQFYGAFGMLDGPLPILVRIDGHGTVQNGFLQRTPLPFP